MSLKDLRANYLSGSISKQVYVDGVLSVLSSLEDVREFMNDSDIRSVKILSGGGALSADSSPCL